VPGDYKISQSQRGSLLRKSEPAGRKSAVVHGTLDRPRKIVLGGAVLARAKVDTEFRRAVQLALEKALEPMDRAILRELMQQWGWPPGRA